MINKKNKVILHIDGDAFFVGVEMAKNPKLKGLPVVTGEGRGIVSALSYEAKAIGIKRGMPIFKVKRDFPSVIVLPGDYESYVKYSKKMFDIVRRYADVEEYSIDECFADLTGLERVLKMTPRQIAEHIKLDVNKELDLSVSIGIAPTKVLAKVASKWIKPNGLTVITEDKIPEYLSNTPIEKIWGIGPKTSDLLRKKKIMNAQDFVLKDISWVKENLSKPYEILWNELKCISVIEFNPNPKNTYSSIQKTRTFHPATNNKSFLLSQISKHTEEACIKARYYKLVAHKISFFLKTKNFEYHVYQFSLPHPTNTPEVILPIIEAEFTKVYRKNILYRTAGISLEQLGSISSTQSDLFGENEKNKKFEKIHEKIDMLENKFGKRAVYLASTYNAQKHSKKESGSKKLNSDLLFIANVPFIP